MDAKTIPANDYIEKISGRMAIAAFFGWSIGKYQRRKRELKKSGVLYYEWQGRPPRKVPCIMKRLALIWISLKAEKGECI